jgi:predicted permease
VSAPRWTIALIRRLAPPGRAEDVQGDLEEAHGRRRAERSPFVADLLTGIEALELCLALLVERARAGRTGQAGESSWPRVSWLDFKLGFRMLVRYPGLTLVGGLALAFAIWVGAGTFEFLSLIVSPRLPLDEGDRIVAVRNWDISVNRAESRALHDFVAWREALATVDDLGAYRDLERNLIVEEGRAEPIRLAEISASAFRVARVSPFMGRAIIEEDEHAAAPAVIVIGYEVWRSRFGEDPFVVGRTVRVGIEPHTVVGVMPEGFEFPRAHDAWTPLRLNPLDYARREGPGIQIFGRLARGVSLADVQAELNLLGQRATADFPRTHEHLRPQVMHYPRSFYYTLSGWYALALMSSNLLVLLLLALIGANVALLMFARAATRESEIIVRSALGASRSRIIAQLFAEALVLGALAAMVGLAGVKFGLTWALAIAETEFMDGGGRLPFWFTSRLSPATLLYTALLTVLGAAIAGVLPALKVTRGIGARLKQASAGSGGLRFGGVWTAVIVIQVALTVTFPAVSFFLRRDIVQMRDYDVGFADEEFVSVRLELDRQAAAFATSDTSRAAFLQHFAVTTQELERRLAALPAVTAVTFTDELPRTYHGWNQIELDEGAVPPRDSIYGHRVAATSIDPDYFDVLEAPILAGRGFHAGDQISDARVVIVNQPFVKQVLGGLNPIGRRLRYVAGESARSYDPGPWYEIVGVVGDHGTTSGYGRAGFYHPLPSGGTHPIYMAIHVRGDAASFAPRLRATALAMDPALRLENVVPLDEVANAGIRTAEFWLALLAGLTAIVLILSLAGIYAAMSFAVSRRTREIGIRVALGADPRRVALAIFRRPLTQVGLGILAGTALVAFMIGGLDADDLQPAQAGMIAAYALLMTVVCLLACIVPTRRALRIQPTDALRHDG